MPYLRSIATALLALAPSTTAMGQCVLTVTSHSQLKGLVEGGSLLPGDVVCVDLSSASLPGIDATLDPIVVSGQGAPGNPIVIRGVPYNGARPVLEAVFAQPSGTNSFPVASGHFDFRPTARHWVLEGFELRGATQAGPLAQHTNSWEGPAGVRVDGQDIVIRNCDSHDNNVGFFTWIHAQDVLFENCEVHHNLRHNMNMFAETLTVRGCYLHDSADNSVNYKERCRVTVLEGNRIEGAGAGGYEVDFAGSWTGLAPGATRTMPYENSYALMLGNTVIHSNAVSTPTVVNLGDGDLNLHFAPRTGFVDLIHNTIVSSTNNQEFLIRRVYETTYPPTDLRNVSCTARVRMHNNILHNLNAPNGSSFGNTIFGSLSSPSTVPWSLYPTEGSGNWFSCHGAGNVVAHAPGLTGSLYGLDPGFVSATAPLDLTLAASGTFVPCGGASPPPTAPARDGADPDPLYHEPRRLGAPGAQALRFGVPLLEPRLTGAPTTVLRRDEAARDIGAFEGSSQVAHATDLAAGGSFGVGQQGPQPVLPGPLRLGLSLPASSPYFLFLSSNRLPFAITLPGVRGGLLLDPTGSFFFQFFQGSTNADAERPTLLEFPTPAMPAARNSNVAIQALYVDPAVGLAFTNSAPLFSFR